MNMKFNDNNTVIGLMLKYKRLDIPRRASICPKYYNGK
jgi:hypothetical protein